MKNNQQNDFSLISEILASTDKKNRQQAAYNMISDLNIEETKQLNEILRDKDKINSILNSSAVKQILSKIKQNDNGQHQ